MRKPLLYLLALSLALVLAACETNPPQINLVYWQYTYRQDLSLNREITELSLFLNVIDEDGIEDIETVFIFHDQENLYWEINSDSWVFDNEQGGDWFGINNLRMADNSAFPRGEYRILVRDVGGETAERYTDINPGRVTKNYPLATITAGRLTLQGSAPSYVLRIYDANDQFIHRYVYTPGSEVDLQQEIIQRHKLTGGSYLDIYYFNRQQDAGFTSGPYFLFSE